MLSVMSVTGTWCSDMCHCSMENFIVRQRKGVWSDFTQLHKDLQTSKEYQKIPEVFFYEPALSKPSDHIYFCGEEKLQW